MNYGAHFTPNSNVGANYSVGNVVARIPIKTGEIERGQYFYYDIGRLDPAVMFSFNGEYLDKTRFWFTYPESDEVVDFRNKNFTLTLGIMASRHL
jgi:hypothetical protein